MARADLILINENIAEVERALELIELAHKNADTPLKRNDMCLAWGELQRELELSLAIRNDILGLKPIV